MPFAAACSAAWAAACSPAATPFAIAPCGYIALAVAGALADGVDLAAAPAAAREALVLERAAPLMRAVAAERRAYVAAHAHEFGPGAPSAEGRRGAEAFIALGMAGQWELSALAARDACQVRRACGFAGDVPRGDGRRTDG